MYYVKHPSPRCAMYYICYLLLSLCSVFIFILIVLCLTTDLNLLHGDYIPMTYPQADEFCSKRGKSLLFPTSERHEDIYIRGIFYSKARHCNFVFLGWVADRSKRYKSADLSGKIWGSLNIDEDIGLPRDILLYRISLNNNSVIATYQYDKQNPPKGSSMLFLSDLPDATTCHKHRYKCVYRFKPEYSGEELMSTYKKALNGPDKLYSVVPFEKNVIPENFNVLNPSSEDAVLVFAVKFNFEYEYQSIKMEYKSRRFVVVDPEYDCLAYDLRRDKLVTRHCEDVACPVCF